MRAIYADWERGSLSRTEWADPEIEYVRAGSLTGERVTWKGLTGMAEGAREGIDVYENIRTEAEDYRELDSGRVLVLERRTGRGKRSGLPLDPVRGPLLGAHLFHIRDGKVTRIVAYGTATAPSPTSASPRRMGEALRGVRSVAGRERRHARTCSGACRRDLSRLRAILGGCEVEGYSAQSRCLGWHKSVRMVRKASQTGLPCA